MRNLIIGLGSGRCGTLSLANLLDKQKNADVTHERYPVKWGCDEKNATLFCIDILFRSAGVVGDVGVSWLNNVPFLIGNMRDVRFVCLKRDREQTIDSFRKRFRSKNFLVDRESGHYDQSIQFRYELDFSEGGIAFPRYDMDKNSAIERYYDDYYEIAGKMAEEYVENFKIFHTECLNTDEGQREILDFCRITDPVLLDENRHNENAVIQMSISDIDSDPRKCRGCGKTNATNVLQSKTYTWHAFTCNECIDHVKDMCVDLALNHFRDEAKPCVMLDRRKSV